ncbi:MAG TPA: ABC transporter ATP-binding protein [Solirubrobacteraceae bacterium]|nr:ABC transporter ATP-binding protein [Solirubrobacteraceae bacterium]
MGSSPYAIVAEDLFKSYSDLNALRGITFHVTHGEVFALLGPNGAGKTTTLEILEGHRSRSGGRVSVLGCDPQLATLELRDRIGIVLQSAGIDGQLTVREVLSLHGACYSRSLPVNDVIELFGLSDQRRARVGTLSGGQRRRLDLALALIGDPDLIFLDEPTIGLDPAARRSAWELIDELHRLGRTIVLTSHYMDEVQRLADRAIVLAHGSIVAEGDPNGLGDNGSRETVIRFRLSGPDALERLPAEVRGLARWSAGAVSLRTAEPTRALHALCDWAVEHGEELRGLEVIRPSLEDVYLQLTGEDRNGKSPSE